MDLPMILASVAGFFFVIPFFVWGVVRFVDKQKQRVLYWKKPLLIWTFLGCFLIGLILILLAIFL
ncbi:hypothetical protein [Mesoplasma seiffertii]|uniref:hypothetical protein n=1 Tax=Mesoplasma seiffertii TaxID=28224 RepID=UPI00047B94D7|nr:hypothetical protein [Mesoplasma seiffertii]